MNTNTTTTTTTNNDKRFTTYAGWRRAARQIDERAIFEGDKDIAQAFRHGSEHRAMKQGDSIGEWDGAEGIIYQDATSTELTFEEVGEQIAKRFDCEDTERGWVATSKTTGNKIRQRRTETDDQFMARLLQIVDGGK